MDRWKQNALYSLIGLLLGGLCMFCVQSMWTEDSKEAELLDRIKQYEANEQEAIINKRVSQQMEEIAYQQKEISDLDRLEAEKQIVVAEEMRKRAEEGERAAHDAQLIAVRSARMADSLRFWAVDQMQLAENRLNQVIQTQQKNDTLSYTSLANALSNYALDNHNSGNQELANMLTYSAYTYGQRYQAQNAQIYKAVLVNGLVYPSFSVHKGSVKRVTAIGKDQKDRISVSSYGEIVHWKSTNKTYEPTTLFSDAKYDFRDVITVGDHDYYALDVNGWLWKGNTSAKTGAFIQLHGKKYSSICRFDQNRLIMASSSTIDWYNVKEDKITYSPALPLLLSALCVKDGLVYLFYQNGDCQTMNAVGQLKPFKLPVKGKVLRAVLFNRLNLFILGMQDGTLHFVSDKGVLLGSLAGHSSGIIDIQQNDNFIVTSSYDKTVRFWVVSKGRHGDVVYSIDLSYGDWPMSLYTDADSKMLWIGLENGNIQPMSYSVEQNIAYIQQQIKRNYTQEEWETYMGDAIPYEKIK